VERNRFHAHELSLDDLQENSRRWSSDQRDDATSLERDVRCFLEMNRNARSAFITFPNSAGQRRLVAASTSALPDSPSGGRARKPGITLALHLTCCSPTPRHRRLPALQRGWLIKESDGGWFRGCLIPGTFHPPSSRSANSSPSRSPSAPRPERDGRRHPPALGLYSSFLSARN